MMTHSLLYSQHMPALLQGTEDAVNKWSFINHELFKHGYLLIISDTKRQASTVGQRGISE